MGRSRKVKRTTTGPAVVGATPATQDQPFALETQRKQAVQDDVLGLDTCAGQSKPASMKVANFFTAPPRTAIFEKDSNGVADTFKSQAAAPANLGEISGMIWAKTSTKKGGAKGPEAAPAARVSHVLEELAELDEGGDKAVLMCSEGFKAYADDLIWGVRAPGEADDAPLDTEDAIQVKDRLQQVWASWRKLTPQQQRTWAERQLAHEGSTAVKQATGGGKKSTKKPHLSLWSAESAAVLKSIGAGNSRKKPDGWGFSRPPAHASRSSKAEELEALKQQQEQEQADADAGNGDAEQQRKQKKRSRKQQAAQEELQRQLQMELDEAQWRRAAALRRSKAALLAEMAVWEQEEEEAEAAAAAGISVEDLRQQRKADAEATAAAEREQQREQEDEAEQEGNEEEGAEVGAKAGSSKAAVKRSSKKKAPAAAAAAAAAAGPSSRPASKAITGAGGRKGAKSSRPAKSTKLDEMEVKAEDSDDDPSPEDEAEMERVLSDGDDSDADGSSGGASSSDEDEEEEEEPVAPATKKAKQAVKTAPAAHARKKASAGAAAGTLGAAAAAVPGASKKSKAAVVKKGDKKGAVSKEQKGLNGGTTSSTRKRKATAAAAMAAEEDQAPEAGEPAAAGPSAAASNGAAAAAGPSKQKRRKQQQASAAAADDVSGAKSQQQEQQQKSPRRRSQRQAAQAQEEDNGPSVSGAGPSPAALAGRPAVAGTAKAARIDSTENQLFSNTRRPSSRQKGLSRADSPGVTVPSSKRSSRLASNHE